VSVSKLDPDAAVSAVQWLIPLAVIPPLGGSPSVILISAARINADWIKNKEYDAGRLLGFV
jgi:hypothetical protein